MKRFLAVLLTVLLCLVSLSALAEHTIWKDYFSEYKLGQLVVYKGSKPTVTAEQFWDMARERNVYGWGDTPLISIFQLLEYAHDGTTNHPTYMRDLFLQHLYIDSERYYDIGSRSFHSFVIRGQGISLQPLTIVFEVEGERETLVECERPYKQEVAVVDHLDTSYGIKLFDYNQRLLGAALSAIESGNPQRAKDMIWGVNQYDSGNHPRKETQRTTIEFVPPNDKIWTRFNEGSMPVYAEPTYRSERLGNGKATLGSNSDFYWYGNSGDWALVEYSLSKGGWRVGWVYYPAGRYWQADTNAEYFQEGLDQVG